MVAAGVSGLSWASSPVPCPGGADPVGVGEGVPAGVSSGVASGSIVAVVSASIVVVAPGSVVPVVTTVAGRFVVTEMPVGGKAKTGGVGVGGLPHKPS